MAIAVSAFLTLALAEIRSARAGDVISPDDQDLVLAIFNEYLDWLNAHGRALYSSTFQTFTLTPNLQPHTIGLTANTPTFSVSVARPSRILHANIVLTNNIRSPLDLIDEDEWNAIAAGAAAGQTPTIKTSIPASLFYSDDWPNGTLNLYPVPTTAYGLELHWQTLLAQMAATDTFDLPPGYQRALRLTVAELSASAFGQTVSATTAREAKDARALVWGDNDTIPNLVTRDAGMPGVSQRGGGYDYRTGMIK